jgi:zinc protease
MDKAVDLVSGWLLGALITPDEYAREYQVVQRELEKGKGEPGRQFHYLQMMNRFRVSPVRVPVIGYQEVIQGLTRDDVYAYYQLTYQPNNIVFALAGDVPPEQMLEAVQKYVNDAAPGRAFQRDIPDEPPVMAPRTVVATFPKLGQAQLSLAFPSIPLDHPDLYALDLLSAVLGDGESALLVEEIRDKQRLVSGISTSSWTPDFADGTFDIEMQLDPDKIHDATKAVLAQLDLVSREGVSRERVDRAKAQVRAARIKSLQTSEAIASSLAGDFMSAGDPHFSDRYVERIQQVTPQQVQAMSRKYFDPSKLLTTVMLPAEYVGAAGLPKAEDLIRPVAPTTRETTPSDAKPQVTRVELGQGNVLLHKRLTTTPIVVMHTFALGGLTAEDAKTNGLGNLAMRLVPRGTKTRSAQQIAEFFDSIGGDLDTSCGNNTWYWNATCLKDDLERAMEVYADVINNPSFPEDEVGPMKQRVLAAIESIDADWTQQAMRFFKQTYFGPQNSPYQFLTIGTAENVSAFTRDQVARWYDEKVKSAERVLAIYGDVELEAAKALAEKHFGRGNKGTPGARDAGGRRIGDDITAKAPFVDVERVETNKTEQPLAGIIIGFESDSVIGDDANFPIAVADTMASGYGYPTGYLHEILRGRGLVYVVHAQNSPGRDAQHPGTFLVYAGCDPRRVNEVVDIILENIARLQGTAEDMQAGWFDRSKQLVVTSDAMDNETPAEQATTAALDELYGLGYAYHDQFVPKINAVKLDDVRETSKARLSRCVVTVSTPAPELVQTKQGLRTYEKFPPVDLTPRGVQHDAGGGPQ